MLDMRREAEKIYDMDITIDEKTKFLEGFLLDCRNEMAAQDQNMKSEIHHEASEGYRMALNYVRKLEST